MKKPLLCELTLREKIGQTCLVHSTQPGFKDLAKYPFGSMWGSGDLDFGVNLDEVNPDLSKRDKWLESIKVVNSKLKVPIVRVTDCDISLPVKEYGHVLDAMTVGATDSEELAYQRGNLIGRMFRHYGLNWIWSPVCDLSSTGGGRTYSSDPDKLITMNIATMKGFQDAGIAATIKHFPGGDGIESRDSHFSEAKNLSTLEEWTAKQGRVFQELIDAGVEAVMMRHASFPAVDNRTRNGRYVPASLSDRVITGLLKGKMGFKGVVITDDVWMRSILTFCDDRRDRVYVEAIKAGNDIVLGAKQDYIDIIEEAVNRGEISMERIDDACQRVLDMKEKIGLFKDDDKIAEGDLDKLNADMADFCDRASKKSITLVCDKNNLFPLSKEKIKKICIIYAGHDTEVKGRAYDNMSVMVEEFEKRGAKVHLQHGLLNNYASEAELEEIAKNYDLILYPGYLGRWMPRGKISFYGDEISTFQNALRYGTEKSAGIGIGNTSIYYNFYSAFPTYISLCTFLPEVLKATVAAMYGELSFEGCEPFPLIPQIVKERLALFGAEEME